MPYKVTIKTGTHNVMVGGRGPFDPGDVVLLTDEEYAAIRPTAFGSIFEAAPAALNTTTANPYT
jgi:hypothetical protein